MLNIIDASGYPIVSISRGYVFSVAAIYLAIVLALYGLRSAGLYILAKRQGVKSAWMSFVPCLWIYVVCKLIGNARFFFDSFSRLAVVITILFTASAVLDLLWNFFNYYPIAHYYLEGYTVNIVSTAEGLKITPVGNFVNHFDTPAINTICSVIGYASIPLDIIQVVITVFAFIALFKKFWPQHYVIASVLSFLGLFAPFAFAIRKKDPVDYAEFIRQKMSYYGNPYGTHPYGRPNNGGYGAGYGSPYDGDENRRNSDGEEPFSEFDGGKSKGGEPFDEFDKDKKE